MNLRLNTGLCTIASIMLFLTSCVKETDNKIKWGSEVIYMPQAAILNGGTTNNYPVPLNNNPATRNYIVDSVANTVQIVLGVTRSGLQPLKAFTVKVETDIDTTSKIVAAGGIANAVLLPQDTYTLPTEVSVPEGNREAIFYLTIDRKKLKEKYAQHSGKNLILTVGISTTLKENITLNQALRRTVVIIDAKTFM